MGRTLSRLFVLALLLTGAPCHGERLAFETGPQEAGPWRSFLHRALLDRSDVIVRAHFVSDMVLQPSAVQVTRFKRLAVLKGKAPSLVLVAGMGERARAFRDLDKLLFLRRMKSGHIFRLVDLVDLIPEESEGREALVRFYLGLDEVTSPLARQARLKRHCLKCLKAPGSFVRKVAIHELEDLSRRRPAVFSAEDLSRLRCSFMGLGPRERRLLEETRRRLRARLALPFPGYEEIFSDPRDRADFIAATADLKRAPDPQSRVSLLDRMVRRFGLKMERFLWVLLEDRERGLAERAAHYLGEFGSRDSVPALLACLRRGTGADPGLLIEALGKTGGTEAVPTIKSFLDRPGLIDTCILALGRIGGPEAETILARLQKTLESHPDQATRARLVARVRTSEFRREERERRRKSRMPYVQK